MTKSVKEVLATCGRFLINGYWAALAIFSYNAPINLVRFSRGWGKSTCFKIRAYRRFIRRGKGTVWVRMTKGETKKTRDTFLNKKFFKLTGADPEKVRINGDYIEGQRI